MGSKPLINGMQVVIIRIQVVHAVVNGVQVSNHRCTKWVINIGSKQAIIGVQTVSTDEGV